MNTLWTKALAVTLLAAAASVLTAACAENESSLFIRGCLVPDEQCLVEFSTDTPFLPSGSMDVRVLGQYDCPLLMGNQLAPLGNDSLRTETSRIQVYAFDVTVTDRDEAVVGEFSSPTAGFIDPGQAPSPGYGGAFATLIDADTATKLAERSQTEGRVQPVTVTVIARGRTLGGTELESAPWTFPVSVCLDCFCNSDPNCAFPADADISPGCFWGREGLCVSPDTSCAPTP